MHTNVLLTCTNALLTHTMTRSTHVTLLHYLLNTSHLLNYLVSFSSSCACGVGGRARAVWFEEDIPKWGECWHTNIHPILGNKVVCGNLPALHSNNARVSPAAVRQTYVLFHE